MIFVLVTLLPTLLLYSAFRTKSTRSDKSLLSCSGHWCHS